MTPGKSATRVSLLFRLPGWGGGEDQYRGSELGELLSDR